MFGLGLPELLIVLLIVLVVFGAGKLPEIGMGLGKALRGFKKGMAESDEIDITPKPLARSEAPPRETEKNRTEHP